MCKRQRPPQHRFGYAEQHGSRAHAECKGGDGQSEKTRAFHQCPESQPQFRHGGSIGKNDAKSNTFCFLLISASQADSECSSSDSECPRSRSALNLENNADVAGSFV